MSDTRWNIGRQSHDAWLAWHGCRRLGLPPDKLEEYVRALVTTMRGVEKALREEGLARSAAAIAAVLAPFKGLEEP